MTTRSDQLELLLDAVRELREQVGWVYLQEIEYTACRRVELTIDQLDALDATPATALPVVVVEQTVEPKAARPRATRKPSGKPRKKASK